jgi:hypothetical protein
VESNQLGYDRDMWHVRFDGAEIIVKHSTGMANLAARLAGRTRVTKEPRINYMDVIRG